MLGAERFLANRQRAPEERFGFGVVAHRLVKQRQVVEAACGVGMLRTICLFTDLQELPSDEDSLLVFARLVKVNNLPIEGLSLGGVLRLSRRTGCHPQRAMQNKQDCQCVSGHPETEKKPRCRMLAHQHTGTHGAVKIQLWL